MNFSSSLNCSLCMHCVKFKKKDFISWRAFCWVSRALTQREVQGPAGHLEVWQMSEWPELRWTSNSYWESDRLFFSCGLCLMLSVNVFGETRFLVCFLSMCGGSQWGWLCFNPSRSLLMSEHVWSEWHLENTSTNQYHQSARSMHSAR